MSKVIDRILAEICLDERLPDGIFDLSNNVHMDVLRENLQDHMGLSLNDALEIHNKMLEGKYPERQAYNKDGLLVTFPTPQHKAKAIQRGSHFEQDPSKGQNGGSNVFGGGQPQGSQPQASGQQSPAGGGAPQQNIFSPEQQPPSDKPVEPSPQGTALPPSDSKPSSPPPSGAPSNSSPSALPASGSPTAGSDKQPLAVEPPANSSQAAAPPPPNFEQPKSPQQRAAEAEAVKSIMRGNNNNPTAPTINERRYLELNRVYHFCKEMGYIQAMTVISEAMNTK
jgi:hypothetical protein